ncbi:thermonuclease family protein, partial [Gordonia humi]
FQAAPAGQARSDVTNSCTSPCTSPLINHELIADGAGRQYAYQNQSYRYRDSFEAVEATARGKDLGLWGHCP